MRSFIVTTLEGQSSAASCAGSVTHAPYAAGLPSFRRERSVYQGVLEGGFSESLPYPKTQAQEAHLAVWRSVWCTNLPSTRMGPHLVMMVGRCDMPPIVSPVAMNQRACVCQRLRQVAAAVRLKVKACVSSVGSCGS